MMRIGIIGMGGFAGYHHDHVKMLDDAGKCKLACTCDPNPAAFRADMTRWNFVDRGVRVFGDWLQMLDECADSLDVVTIPTPVPLHAAMHKACVDRGIPVFLEKPPTVNYTELDEMLEVEERAKKTTEVGFNFISDPARQNLKKRILGGEFGSLRRVCFKGLWPRSAAYFDRASWVARLMKDGRLVLDSCMSNAMAHYIHNALFWAGTGELLSWAEVREVSAEMYRAHDIEGMDTVFARGTTDTGVDIRIVLSHAERGDEINPEWLKCDKAVIRYTNFKGYEIDWKDGRVETGSVCDKIELSERLDAYFSYLRGESERPLTRLIDTKTFVHFCDLAYVAAGKISDIPEKCLERFDVPEESSRGVAITGLNSAADEFFKTDRLPSEQGLAWGSPGGSASNTDLHKLNDVITKML